MQSPSRRQAATLSPGASNRPPVPGFGSSIDTTDGGLKQKQTSPAPANTTNAASTGATFPIIPSVPIALSLSDLSNEDERQQDAGPAIHRSKQQPAEDTGGPGPADISVGTASMSASPRVPTNVERMHCDARSSSRDAAGSVDVDANMDGDTAVGLELNSAGSPRESGGDVEMLYEYFPLSVDDWYV